MPLMASAASMASDPRGGKELAKHVAVGPGRVGRAEHDREVLSGWAVGNAREVGTREIAKVGERHGPRQKR